MKRLLALTAYLALATGASAQPVPPGTNPLPIAGSYNSIAPTCSNTGFCQLQTDVNGLLKITGNVSSSAAGFTPGLTYATLTAAGTSGSVALPAGTVVAFTNTGTTAVSCTLGVGSATAVAGQIQVFPSSTVFLTVGANTFGACIDETGSASNVVRLAGGTGLGTGFGGGGGSSGGGGAVTVADGADVTQGALADAASAAGGTGSLSAKLRLMTTQLGTINTTLGSPFQAGGSIGNTSFGISGTLPAYTAIPTFKFDQTTPGTTNGVAIVGVNAATALAGNGVTGTGSQRVTIASDNTAFSVNAIQSGTWSTQSLPGTTGGLSVFFLQPTASDNHAVIKAGAGQVYKIAITNNQAVVNYVRLYNATTGFNGCNSATNLVYENAIPGNTTATGIMDEWSQGMAFSTGISICVTTGYATTDTTNATASAMNVNIGYK